MPATLFAEVSIPEPMFFDLVRRLGAKKGELEINTLGYRDFYAKHRNKPVDYFGSSVNTHDRGKIEWAPEVEYVIEDGLAVEFELPFEGKYLEAYKVATQYTFGEPSDNYIHGMQIIVEPTVRWGKFTTTALYIGGYRINEIFSTLFMVGGRTDLKGNENHESFDYIANGSLFANITHEVVLGLETNYSRNRVGDNTTLFIPQIQYEVDRHVAIQVGLSFKQSTFSNEKAFVLRAVYSF